MEEGRISRGRGPVNARVVLKGWTQPIRDVLIYSGAQFLCPCAGTINLMPGTSSIPAFRQVNVDVNTGMVSGLLQKNSRAKIQESPCQGHTAGASFVKHNDPEMCLLVDYMEKI
jgi:hypothetical protein